MSLRFILASVMMTAVYSIASAQVPLPTDLSIQPPGTDVPAEDAAFSGAWGNGAWDGSTPTALIVEQVDEDGTAKVIYARGATEHPKITDHWLSLSGRIEDHCLAIHLSDPDSSAGFLVQYRIVAPGRLEGDLTTRDGWRTAGLSPANPRSARSHYCDRRTTIPTHLARDPYSGAFIGQRRIGSDNSTCGNAVSHAAAGAAAAGDPQSRSARVCRRCSGEDLAFRSRGSVFPCARI